MHPSTSPPPPCLHGGAPRPDRVRAGGPRAPVTWVPRGMPRPPPSGQGPGRSGPSSLSVPARHDEAGLRGRVRACACPRAVPPDSPPAPTARCMNASGEPVHPGGRGRRRRALRSATPWTRPAAPAAPCTCCTSSSPAASASATGTGERILRAAAAPRRGPRRRADPGRAPSWPTPAPSPTSSSSARAWARQVVLQRRSGPGHGITEGSTCAEVARRAGCPVVLVPDTHRGEAPLPEALAGLEVSPAAPGVLP